MPLDSPRRRLRLVSRLAAAALACLVGVASAQAATITRTYGFDVTWASGPLDDWVGRFTLTFDPDVSSFGSVTGYTSNMPPAYGSSLFYIYAVGSPTSRSLTVGNACSTVACGITNGTNTVYLFASMGLGPNTPLFVEAAYGSSSQPGIFGDQDPDSVIFMVAEPASLLLLAGTAGALAATRRRRQLP